MIFISKKLSIALTLGYSLQPAFVSACSVPRQACNSCPSLYDLFGCGSVSDCRDQCPSGTYVAPFPQTDTPVGDTVANIPRSGCFQLTPSEYNKVGAVWASGTIDLDTPFSIEKAVYLGENDSGGEGMAFVIQNSMPNPMTVIGNGGSGQGYDGIMDAIIIELDTRQNYAPTDNPAVSGDHLQIYDSDCYGMRVSLTGPIEIGFNIEDGNEHTFKVSWDGTSLEVSIDGDVKTSLAIGNGDLKAHVGNSTLAHYGFTAATRLDNTPTSDNNAHYVCDVCISGCQGDPHFRTWSGEKYDFHGVCDMVLLQSRGLDVHIRTKRSRMWSFIHSVTVRIGNDILEVMGGADENRFWLNKVRSQSTKDIVLSGYSVEFSQVNEKSRKYVIDMGSKGVIELKTWNGMVSVTMAGFARFGNDSSLGLMGTFPDGVKMDRDNHHEIGDVNDFAQEWQVRSTDPKLFHNIEGPQYPEQCELPSHSDMRRRLGESMISKEDAAIACSRVNEENFDLCVFDVIATNDRDSAGAY